MRKVLIYGILLTLMALAVSLAGCTDVSDSDNNKQVTEEESKEIAREFVENSPTYQYDGYNLTYKETLYPDVVNCTSCYGFVFGFESRHAGYGNRTGQMLAQVITPHEAHIMVKNGEVTSALLDMKWNMLNQTFVDNAAGTDTPTPTKTETETSGGESDKTPQEEFCGWSTQGNCSTDADCTVDGCSDQVCRSTSEEPVFTTCEYKECYNADLYNMECRCVEGACQWSQ